MIFIDYVILNKHILNKHVRRCQCIKCTAIHSHPLFCFGSRPVACISDTTPWVEPIRHELRGDAQGRSIFHQTNIAEIWDLVVVTPGYPVMVPCWYP